MSGKKNIPTEWEAGLFPEPLSAPGNNKSKKGYPAKQPWISNLNPSAYSFIPREKILGAPEFTPKGANRRGRRSTRKSRKNRKSTSKVNRR